MVQVQVFRSQVLDLVPRSPADLRQMLQHAQLVLDQEPRMRWACFALVLAGLALAFSRRRRSTLASVLVVAVTGFVWLRVNQVREGDILVEFSSHHGLTEADLLVPVVAVLAVAGWLLRRFLDRRPGPAGAQPTPG